MQRSRRGGGGPTFGAMARQNTLLERLRGEARRIRSQLRKVGLRLRIGENWREEDRAFGRRAYPNYEAYLAHQRTKLDAMRPRSLAGHDARFHAALSQRLAELPFDLRGQTVLCLAARQGTEVRAFIEQGAFAVGIDLNPGHDNRWVVVGDFHDLQYTDGSVSIVYTNSLDHAFELERVLAEVRRVLRADGWLITEVARDAARGFYESLSWSSVDALLEVIAANGFDLERRTRFEKPWQGEQLLLKKA